MEQMLTNKDLTEKAIQQQTKPNNSILPVVIISIFLSVTITGSTVYFWQKSANEEMVSSLEQKVLFLEEQILSMKDDDVKDLDPLCSTKATSEGLCDTACFGFEYDSTKNECKRVTNDGCVCKIPFESIEECQNICIDR